MNFALNNKEEIMIDPKDALTEQELDRLVELDAASQGDVAGGTATPATRTIEATAQAVAASAALIEATKADFMPTSACTTRC
jgi:hypothetical protein